nr:MAG TPA: hypothetical protein [Caudoviricetes sp.]
MFNGHGSTSFLCIIIIKFAFNCQNPCGRFVKYV